MEVEVDLGVRASPSPVSKEPRPREPRIAEPDILIYLLYFAVVSLSCVVALLGTESLSSSQGVAKSYRGFF